jgi:hypothetical protein
MSNQCFVLMIQVMAPTRKNYSLKTKLDVIRSYQKVVNGCGLPSLAAANGRSVGTLRGWINKRQELEAALANNDIETRKGRHLAGGGRQAKYEELEDQKNPKGKTNIF